MNKTINKEEAKRQRLFGQVSNYVTKINTILSDLSPKNVRNNPNTKGETIEEQVYNLIEKSGSRGMTSDQVLRKLPNLPYGSVTSRYASLKRSGLVKVNGTTRVGNAGRQQSVMYASKHVS